MGENSSQPGFSPAPASSAQERGMSGPYFAPASYPIPTVTIAHAVFARSEVADTRLLDTECAASSVGLNRCKHEEQEARTGDCPSFLISVHGVSYFAAMQKSPWEPRGTQG